MKPCAPQISAAGRKCRYLGEDERKLYDLIWKRAVASQMEAAIMEQVAVDIASWREHRAAPTAPW